MVSEIEAAVDAEPFYPPASRMTAQLHHHCLALASAVRNLFRPSASTEDLAVRSIREVSELETLAYQRCTASEALSIASAQMRGKVTNRFGNAREDICALGFDKRVSDAVKALQNDPSALVDAYLKAPSAKLADAIVNGILGEHCCGPLPALEWFGEVLRRGGGKERVMLAAAVAFGFRDQTLLFFASAAVECRRLHWHGPSVERLDALLSAREPPDELVVVVRLLERFEEVGKRKGLSAEGFVNEVVAKMMEMMVLMRRDQLRLGAVFEALRNGACVLERFMKRVRSANTLPMRTCLYGCHWVLQQSHVEIIQVAVDGVNLLVHPEMENGIYIVPLEDVESTKEVKLWRGIHALLSQVEEALYREAVTVHPRLAFTSRLSELQRIHKDLQVLHGEAFELQHYAQSVKRCIDELELKLDRLKTSEMIMPSLSGRFYADDRFFWSNIQNVLSQGSHVFVCGTKLQEGIAGMLAASEDNTSIALNDQVLFMCSHIVGVRFEPSSRHVDSDVDGRNGSKVNVLLLNDDLVQVHMRSPAMALLWTYGLQQLSGDQTTMRRLTRAEYQWQRAFYLALAQETIYP